MKEIQSIPISWRKRGGIQGKIEFYSRRKNKTIYKNKIVVIEDLNLNEIVFLLNKVRAIIAEKGGITNHGANLAREYKIPCVVLPQAKKHLEEKETVEIDSNGKIKTAKNRRIKKVRADITRRRLPAKKNGWFLTRTYARSLLESNWEAEGISITPKVLMGKKRKASCYFDSQGLRWVKNFPLPHEIAEKILNEPLWFKKKVEERKKLYRKIKRHTNSLVNRIKKNKLTLKDCAKELEKLRLIYIERRPYTALTQHPLDHVEEKFYDSISSFMPKNLQVKLYDQVIRTEYAKKASRYKKGLISRKKSLIFPPENLTYIDTSINYKKKINIDPSIEKIIAKQPKAIRDKFYHYCKTINLLTKLSDETAYIRRTLRICLINILEKIGKYLLKRGKIKRLRQVLNYKSQNLSNILKEEIKRTEKPKSIQYLFQKDPRIRKIFNLSRKRFKECARIIVHHSFDHTLRVLYRAITIAKTEKDVDYSILIPAVLLHDIGVTTRKNRRHHSQNSITLAKKILPKLKYSKEEIKHICDCISTHGGFSVKRRKEPESLEAKILWDSDALERSSAAAAFYVYGIFFEKKKPLDKFIQKRTVGLKRTIKRGFYTEKAKKINQNGVKELLRHYQKALTALKRRKDLLINEDNFHKIGF